MILHETRCVVDQAARERNILHALSLGLPVCKMGPDRGELAIVAAGPSVNEYRDELINFSGKVWAINGAYSHLRKSFGITPDFVGLDPQQALVGCFNDLSRDSTFYIASHCHPDVFKRLEGYKVKLWHTSRDTVHVLPSGSCVVPGGMTAVTRAPFLGNMEGFRDIYIYGADCSYADSPYAYATDSDVCDPTDKTQIVECPPGSGQFFKSEMGLLHQASNIGAMMEIFPHVTKARLTIRCGGLLPVFLSSTRPVSDFDDNVHAGGDGDARAA